MVLNRYDVERNMLFDVESANVYMNRGLNLERIKMFASVTHLKVVNDWN